MLHLTNIYWNNFKQDGQLFENLTGDLLKFKYPGRSFVKTQTTHDDNRDWEISIPLLDGLTADIWYECKYYKEKLSVKDISMTLIMAYIENVREIVIFSYSPVNREFIKKISRFTERSKIPVYIYDDCKLESLIFKYWTELDTNIYFPTFHHFSAYSEPTGISVCSEVYRNDQKISCYNKDNLPIVRFNDLIIIRLILTNNNLNDIAKVKIWINSSSKRNYTIHNDNLNFNKSAYLSVNTNGIVSFSIFLKLKTAQERIELPKIIVECENEKKQISLGKIEAQWLADAPLIGQAFHDIIFLQKKSMRSRKFTVCQIIGYSGVGKSRLIQEAITEARILEKQVYHLDNDIKKTSYASFIRNMVSILEGLPELSSKKTINVISENHSIHNMTARILYHNKALSQISTTELASYLFELMKKKAIWVLIDNVQWMDEKSLDLISQLLSYAGKPSESGMFLTFNRDYLYSGTKADQVFKRVESYSAKYPDVIYSTELNGFSFEDAQTYLYECLTYKTESKNDKIAYRHTLEKIIEHCGCQPFYLQNMLLYLSQLHVLERTQETSFYITNITKFLLSVQELPKPVFSLLEQRFSLIRTHFKKTKRDKIFDCFCALLSFCNQMPSVLYREIFKDFSIKRELISLGILTETDNCNLTFYHQYYELYFQSVFPLQEIPNSLLVKFCNAVDKRKIKKSMIDPYYMAQYIMGTCSNQLLEYIMQRIIAWKISPHVSRRIIPFVSLQLDNLSEEFPDDFVAACQYNMCFIVASREGMHKACYYYEKCYQDLLTGEKMYLIHRERVFPLMREYLLSLGNINQNHKAISKANALLSYCKSDSERCAMKEILCISNYAIGETQKAVYEIQDAKKYCSNTKDRITILREHGKSYYFDSNAYLYQDKICQLWEEALKEYNQQYNTDRDIDNTNDLHQEISAYLNAGIADLIRHKIRDAEKKMLRLSRYLDQTKMPFYEIKIRFFRAMVLFQKAVIQAKINDSYQEILDLLNQATDMCVIYYDMQDYPICFYLSASVQIYAGEYEKAIDSYKKACTVIQSHIDNEEEESIWSYFYEEMALRFVQLNKKIPAELLQGIRSLKLRNRIKKLGNCKNADEEIVHCNRSPLLFENCPWSLPKI